MNEQFKQQYNAIGNAHGLYNSEQFVLRLSQPNHQLVEEMTAEGFASASITDRHLKAYSTYIHETIHWWQHIGSTSGFVLSLCYPLQTHSNLKSIKQLCALGAPVKSIKRFAFEGELANITPQDPRQAAANIITNNTMDFEFYKRWLMKPDDEQKIFDDDYFESQGNCFSVVYLNLVETISDLLNKDSDFLKHSDGWLAEFDRLQSDKVLGYFNGSPMFHRKVGVLDLFEGQASFSQMQYLTGVGVFSGDLSEFRSADMLWGVYERAFLEFLTLTGIKPPKSVNDSAIGLFLLICDLSINPVEGFPCDIPNFKNFVNAADPGLRFEMLCGVVKRYDGDLHIHLKEYSKDEYIFLSSFLLKNAGLAEISDGWNAVAQWSQVSTELRLLMEQFESFEYGKENTLLKVILANFVSFTLDKASRPEFFCWPGLWISKAETREIYKEYWVKHQSFFTDAEYDDGIFARKFNGISDENLHKTLINFFGNNLIYDLSRQWALNEGEFTFDFRWLSEHIDASEWEKWGNEIFRKMYGVSIAEIAV